jgi:hypothetical protein
VVNRWLWVPVVMLGCVSIAGCTSDATTTRTTTATAPTVLVPDDRSLDVTYSSGSIELSFARLGHPFRSMYAKVSRWDNGAWRHFAVLRTAEADTPGELITGDPNEIEVLDGVNTQSAADRYSAAALGAGRYLVCSTLAEADDHRDVCGELDVP